MELSVDTSTRYAGLCLSQEGEALIELTWRSERNHTVELAPAVEMLLDRVGATFKDLTALVIAQGPGNFSALRVGMSYVKGLAFALQIPMAAVGTLEIEAAPYLDLGFPVYALLDAGRSEVVWARFTRERQEASAQVSTLDDLCRQTEASAVLCGEAALHHQETLLGLLAHSVRIVTATLPSRRPTLLASLGHQRLASGQQADVGTLQPHYARAPSITAPKPPKPIR